MLVTSKTFELYKDDMEVELKIKDTQIEALHTMVKDMSDQLEESNKALAHYGGLVEEINEQLKPPKTFGG